MSDEKVKEVKSDIAKEFEGIKDAVVLEIERIEFSNPSGLDDPVKTSKPFRFVTNSRSFQRNFLKFHKTQGLTITKVLLLPKDVKFDHKEYLDALKPKKKAAPRK